MSNLFWNFLCVCERERVFLDSFSGMLSISEAAATAQRALTFPSTWTMAVPHGADLEDQAGPHTSALPSYCTPAVMEQRGAAAQCSSQTGELPDRGTPREQQCSRADAINTPEYPENPSLMDLP